MILPKRISTIEIMSQTVADAASHLSIIAGKGPYDEKAREIPCDNISDCRIHCKISALHGARIGIPRNAFENNDGKIVGEVELAALESTISAMRKAGAIIVHLADYPEYATFFAKSPPLKKLYNNADWKSQFEQYTTELTNNPSIHPYDG